MNLVSRRTNRSVDRALGRPEGALLAVRLGLAVAALAVGAALGLEGSLAWAEERGVGRPAADAAPGTTEGTTESSAACDDAGETRGAMSQVLRELGALHLEVEAAPPGGRGVLTGLFRGRVDQLMRQVPAASGRAALMERIRAAVLEARAGRDQEAAARPKVEPAPPRRIVRPPRGTIYTDQRGNHWLEVLPEKHYHLNFTVVNGEKVFEDLAASIVPNGEILDSPAIRACRAIGGEMPTWEDYLRLVAEFGATPEGQFTVAGQAAFEAAFPDMGDEHEIFWSSSSVSGFPDVAHGLNRYFGIRLYYVARDFVAHSVLCVVRPRG